VRRGEVYEYAVGSRVARIVVVSADRYSPRRVTCAPIIVGGDDSAAPATTTVAVTTPLAGRVDVTRLRPADANAIRARLGRLAHTTMTEVDRALRTYLDLN
jgi:mRNA-degrading endonuclease toxin of MazEF toxin-antitoxin module